MIYKNRSQAGKGLAQELAGYADQHPIVLALPRGGLPVAAEIAKALDAPLDLLLVRKLGTPGQPELAMGAVIDGAEPHVMRNDEIIAILGIPETEFQKVVRRELAEIERRRILYLGNRPRAQLKGRVAIVVDDGVATGATTRAALQAVRSQMPAKTILAVPVAPTSTIEELSGEADEIICPHSYEPFFAIGFYYTDFRQINDDEVIEILSKVRAPEAAASAPAR
jgi:predicted phosphoribosyltransferase